MTSETIILILDILAFVFTVFFAIVAVSDSVLSFFNQDINKLLKKMHFPCSKKVLYIIACIGVLIVYISKFIKYAMLGMI